jgi:hypothetical protein
MEPLPQQPLPHHSPPSQRPLRRSICLSRLPVQPTLAEQAEGEDNEGDPVYENPELPNHTFYDAFEEHVEKKDGQNGNSNEENGNVPSMVPLDPSSTQYLFWEGTWSQSSNTFSLEPSPYLGEPSGLKHEYTRMLTFFTSIWVILDTYGFESHMC